MAAGVAMLAWMLPLIEIHRLAQSVDDEWRSPIADAVAAAWGHPPGTARWWRSSASHVFVLPETPTVSRAYLRFTPAVAVTEARVHTVSELTRQLHARGVALAAAVPSPAARLVETVGTDLGAMHATCIEAAPGEQKNLDELTTAQAQAWGASLATLHEHASESRDALPTRLPHAADRLAAAEDVLGSDASAAAAVRQLRELLDDLPRCEQSYGVVHGDFELDNLTWVGDAPTSFDYDEAALSWYAADLAHAARDLVRDGQPTAEHRQRYAALLTGYLSVRPQLEPHLSHLPLFARMHAAISLAELIQILADAERLDTDVLPQLRSRLEALAHHHRGQLLLSAAT